MVFKTQYFARAMASSPRQFPEISPGDFLMKGSIKTRSIYVNTPIAFRIGFIDWVGENRLPSLNKELFGNSRAGDGTESAQILGSSNERRGEGESSSWGGHARQFGRLSAGRDHGRGPGGFERQRAPVLAPSTAKHSNACANSLNLWVHLRIIRAETVGQSDR